MVEVEVLVTTRFVAVVVPAESVLESVVAPETPKVPPTVALLLTVSAEVLARVATLRKVLVAKVVVAFVAEKLVSVDDALDTTPAENVPSPVKVDAPPTESVPARVTFPWLLILKSVVVEKVAVVEPMAKSVVSGEVDPL